MRYCSATGYKLDSHEFSSFNKYCISYQSAATKPWLEDQYTVVQTEDNLQSEKLREEQNYCNSKMANVASIVELGKFFRFTCNCTSFQRYQSSNCPRKTTGIHKDKKTVARLPLI